MIGFKVIKIDHIAIASNDAQKINNFFAELLSDKNYKQEEVESEQVRTSFFKVADVNIETLEPLTKESTIAAYLKNNGQGIHILHS